MKRYAYLLWALLPLLAAACGDDSEVFYSVSYPVVRVEASVKGPQAETPGEDDTTGGEDDTTGGEGSDGTGTDETGTGTDGTGTDGTGTGTNGTGTGTNGTGTGTNGTGSIPVGTTNGAETGSDGTESDGTGTDSGTDSGTEEPVGNPLYDQIAAEIVAQAPVKAGGSYRLDFSKYNRGRAPIDTASDAGQVVGIFIKEPGADKIRFYFLEQDYICSISSYKDEKGRDMTRFTVDLTAEYQERYPDAGITEALRVEYTSTPY